MGTGTQTHVSVWFISSKVRKLIGGQTGSNGYCAKLWCFSCTCLREEPKLQYETEFHNAVIRAHVLLEPLNLTRSLLALYPEWQQPPNPWTLSYSWLWQRGCEKVSILLYRCTPATCSSEKGLQLSPRVPFPYPENLEQFCDDVHTQPLRHGTALSSIYYAEAGVHNTGFTALALP